MNTIFSAKVDTFYYIISKDVVSVFFFVFYRNIKNLKSCFQGL